LDEDEDADALGEAQDRYFQDDDDDDHDDVNTNTRGKRSMLEALVALKAARAGGNNGGSEAAILTEMDSGGEQLAVERREWGRVLGLKGGVDGRTSLLCMPGGRVGHHLGEEGGRGLGKEIWEAISRAEPGGLVPMVPRPPPATAAAATAAASASSAAISAAGNSKSTSSRRRSSATLERLRERRKR
jgi:hypothetical protein